MYVALAHAEVATMMIRCVGGCQGIVMQSLSCYPVVVQVI